MCHTNLVIASRKLYCTDPRGVSVVGLPAAFSAALPNQNSHGSEEGKDNDEGEGEAREEAERRANEGAPGQQNHNQ